MDERLRELERRAKADFTLEPELIAYLLRRDGNLYDYRRQRGLCVICGDWSWCGRLWLHSGHLSAAWCNCVFHATCSGCDQFPFEANLPYVRWQLAQGEDPIVCTYGGHTNANVHALERVEVMRNRGWLS